MALPIYVLNTCKKTSKTNEAHGKAYAVEGSSNARLKVSFFWPFYGDYWILDLAEDYSWVIIGEPTGKYLWILARNPILDKNLEEKLLQKIESLGYRRSDLIKPPNKL